MKINFFIILIFLICKIGNAQKMLTISGFVTDYRTGERLINATVYDNYTKNGTITNKFGFFSLNIPDKKELEFIVSYIGYLSYSKKISIAHDTIMEITLFPEIGIKEVSILGEKSKKIEDRLEMGKIEIPLTQIKLLPSIAGEKDFIKAYQLMPGVKFGDEGKCGIYVRGGSPDQNLIMLDDVTIYHVNHLGGFVSIFNTDAISNINLIKGNFPAYYGGRLSSVLDIRMKDGNLKEFQGHGTIGMLSSKLSIEGPFKVDTSSYILSVRRFMYDLFTKPLSYFFLDKIRLGYTFYDINFKVNRRFNENNRIFISLYKGNDNISSKLGKRAMQDFTLNYHNTWGNNVGAIRWNHIYNSKLFSNLTFSFTNYKYIISYESQKKDEFIEILNVNSFSSMVTDFSIKNDFEYYYNQFIKMKFGIGAIVHNFVPGKHSSIITENSVVKIDSVFNNEKYISNEHYFYVDGEIKFTKNFNVNIGFRLSDYLVENEFFYSAEPRVIVNYKLKNGYALKSSYAISHQYIHLLSSSGIGMPTDLWIFSTKSVPPMKSWQTSTGISKNIYNAKIELSIEGYYKNMTGLIDYKEGASILGGSKSWQEKIETNGTGQSYGIELLIQKKEGQTTGWLGITLSRSMRQFSNINFGNPFPYTYDRFVDIGMVVIHKLRENLFLSGTWVFNTGNALTLPVGYYQAINDIHYSSEYKIGYDLESVVEIYEGKNTFRAKPYHRLDLGFEHTKQKRRGIRTISLSIYNAYNNNNPFYYYSTTIKDSNGRPNKNVIKQVSYFPIIPSISYGFDF